MRFRFIDLVVSLAVVVALAVGTLAVSRNAQENAVIVECQQRLGRIGQALAMYSGTYDGQFPRTRYDPAAPLTAYTAPDGPQPAANDTTAAMFLLARTIELPPDAFTCPSAVRHGLAEDDTFDRRTAKLRHNFRARLNVNYALANMYPDAAAVAAGYSLDRYAERLPAKFVIAADTGPGPADARTVTTQMSRGQIRTANSPNHERDGQNVLTADGAVQYYNAATIGVDYDNIYTGRPDTLQPASATDTVLVPAWQEGPALLPALVVGRRWTLVFAVVVTFVALFWVVRNGLKGRGPVVDPGAD